MELRILLCVALWGLSVLVICLVVYLKQRRQHDDNTAYVLAELRAARGELAQLRAVVARIHASAEATRGKLVAFVDGPPSLRRPPVGDQDLDLGGRTDTTAK